MLLSSHRAQDGRARRVTTLSSLGDRPRDCETAASMEPTRSVVAGLPVRVSSSVLAHESFSEEVFREVGLGITSILGNQSPARAISSIHRVSSSRLRRLLPSRRVMAIVSAIRPHCSGGCPEYHSRSCYSRFTQLSSRVFTLRLRIGSPDGMESTMVDRWHHPRPICSAPSSPRRSNWPMSPFAWRS